MKTYRELFEKIATLTDEQLDQEVIIYSDGDYYQMKDKFKFVHEESVWYSKPPKDHVHLEEYPVLVIDK